MLGVRLPSSLSGSSEVTVLFCAAVQSWDFDELSQPGDVCAVVGTQEEVDRRIYCGIE